MTFLCLCSLSFFKNNCFLCFGFFMIVKKKKARKANSHVRWLVMVGSCWCWCSRWLALYDWWLYGITERKPFFLFFHVFVYSNSIGSTLSLSAPWWVPTLFTRPWLWLVSFLVDHEFTTFFFLLFFNKHLFNIVIRWMNSLRYKVLMLIFLK